MLIQVFFYEQSFSWLYCIIKTHDMSFLLKLPSTWTVFPGAATFLAEIQLYAMPKEIEKTNTA